MANYYGTGITNYFAVKDTAAFKAALEPHPFAVYEDARSGKVTVVSADPDESGSLDCMDWDTDEEWVLAEQIVPHLQDGEVAVLIHVGHLKAAYVSGFAVAVHSDGRTVDVNLETEIMTRASKAFGVQNISSPSN